MRKTLLSALLLVLSAALLGAAIWLTLTSSREGRRLEDEETWREVAKHLEEKHLDDAKRIRNLELVVFTNDEIAKHPAVIQQLQQAVNDLRLRMDMVERAAD